MINPMELRVGNWIDTPTGLRQVFEVSEDFINGFHHCIHHSKPIVITNELLLACGFKEKASIFYYRNADIEFCLSFYNDTHKKIWNNSRYLGVLPLQYIHQLQNLYHSLTGVELEVNLFSLA